MFRHLLYLLQAIFNVLTFSLRHFYCINRVKIISNGAVFSRFVAQLNCIMPSVVFQNEDDCLLSYCAM
jgi:hypothetical protein